MTNGIEVTVDVAGSVRVRLAGDLDLSSAPDVEAVVGPAIDERPDSVVIDLGQLAFVDSRGVRELISLKQRADAKGVEWRMINPTPPIVRLLDVLGLNEELNVER